MVWDQSSQDWWFWTPKYHVWALKCVQISSYFTQIHIVHTKNKSIWSSIIVENWVLRFLPLQWALFEDKNLNSWFSPILLDKIGFFYITECACILFCYMRMKYELIKKIRCLNVSFKIVALAVSSILRSRILTLDFPQVYLIKLLFYKQNLFVNVFFYMCVKYELIWTYFSALTLNLSAQNHQSWLLCSQTIP